MYRYFKNTLVYLCNIYPLVHKIPYRDISGITKLPIIIYLFLHKWTLSISAVYLLDRCTALTTTVFR